MADSRTGAGKMPDGSELSLSTQEVREVLKKTKGWRNVKETFFVLRTNLEELPKTRDGT